MNGRCFVNVACGEVYLDDWINLDYTPVSKRVQKADLLKPLPLANGSADLLYSSHFLEHIPKTEAPAFLGECRRALKPGAIIRLVLPDLEELCHAYLAARSAGHHDQADFIVLEMLDQCVRTTAGGDLGALYQQLRSDQSTHASLIDFVRRRTGYDCLVETSAPGTVLQRLLANPMSLLSWLERRYRTLPIALLPPAFRRQNVSLADRGERHAWIYDFHTVATLLRQAGFVDVRRVTATSSAIDGFPFFPLDIHRDGSPRKGLESMYIEAAKP
jgi:SAM-dependent methyltransferase